LPNRIGKARNDDRNRSRGILGRQGRWRSSRHDQVYIQSNQLSREARELVVSAFGRSILDDEVLTLNVPGIPQTSSKSIKVGSVDRRGRSLEHANSVDLP